jgi:hypothetical protein
VACTGCRHGKRKRSCTACKSERKGHAGSPQIKQEPETKQKEPEVKPEPEIKQEPFTIQGEYRKHFSFDK